MTANLWKIPLGVAFVVILMGLSLASGIAGLAAFAVSCAVYSANQACDALWYRIWDAAMGYSQ